MLCHSTTLLFKTVALPFVTLLCNAKTKHTFALPKLRSSPPCPCSVLLLNAFALHIFALPSHPIALPKPCSAQPRQHVARTLHRYSMPLLRYARLGLSVQCLSDTILVIATTKRCLSTPLLSLSSQCLRLAYLCHCRSLLFVAEHRPCAANPCFAISIPNKAIAGHL